MTNTTKAAWMCAFLLLGCQNGTPQPAGDPDGLTIFTADRANGLTGMYKAGDDVVFFETITDPPDEPGDHRLDHGQDASRPMFSSRWTDAEGRTISMDLSGSSIATTAWTEVDPNLDREAAHRDVVLDLAMKAGAELQAQELGPEVREEQAKLAGMADAIPAAPDRVLQATPEQLEQIAARTPSTRGYLGYQWFQQFWVDEAFFHQCTGWDNYRYYSGAWHYFSTENQNNGATCDHRKCGKTSGYVQDYKYYLAACDNGSPTHYGMCDFTAHKYNCRSSALREQTYVLGNHTCSGNSQDNGTMCMFEEDNFGGADCSFHTTCNNRDICY
jgi:hypothetical protein